MTDVAESPPTRGHKKRERTRRRLVAAAIEVIADEGEAFSISDVTDRAGVSNGTFYNYFDDRDALIAEIVPEVVGGFAAANAEVPHEDPAMQFATVSALALRQAAADPDRLRVLLRLDAAQRTLIEGAVLHHLREDIERGVDRGRFDATVDTATLDVVAGTVLLAVHRIIDFETDEDYVPRVLAQLLRSMGLDGEDAADIGRRAAAAATELVAAAPRT